MNTNKSIAAIDYAKLFFAISIVSLHVAYKNEALIYYAQVVGRIGVPFFFTAAGYFLYAGILKNGSRYIGKYCLRIGKLLGIWLIIYLPIFLYTSRYSDGLSILIREILFLTPGYLWYLSSLCVAAFIFGIFYKKHPTIYLLCSILLYLIGCSGNTYIHILKLEGFWQPYLDIFLSTRNALFFAPLFLSIGALLKEEKKIRISLRVSVVLLIVTTLIYVAEVLTVIAQIPTNTDYTFYIALPFVVFFLLYVLFHIKSPIQNTQNIRRFSTFLYCSQFGCMVALDIIAAWFTILKNGMLLWIAVIGISVIIFCILNSNKIGQKIVNWLV